MSIFQNSWNFIENQYIVGWALWNINWSHGKMFHPIFLHIVPLNTWRINNVVITSKRRHFDVITSKWRCFDVITTSLLPNVSAGVTQMYGIGLSHHRFNPLNVIFFQTKHTYVNMYLQFIPFPHSDMTQFVEILPRVTQWPSYFT